MPIKPMTSSAAAMHGAVVPIAYQTLSSTSASITFSNIPQKYQDLMIVIYGRLTISGNGIGWQFNGDGSGNYSYTRLGGTGSSTFSDRASNVASFDSGNFPGSDAASGIFGSTIAHILNYANTSTYKTTLTRSASDINGSGYVQEHIALWRSTSGITSISIYGNNWAAGSSFELFGIRTIGQ
jgi:hypothetical protein